MPQNTMKVQIGDLTIKYSPEFPITYVQQLLLARALNVARRSVTRAIALLEPISATGQTSPAESVRKVLNFHFFQIDPLQSKIDLPQSLDVRRITNNFRSILRGLSSPLTIADAFATMWGHERKKLESEFRRGKAPTKEDYVKRVKDATTNVSGKVPYKKKFLLSLSKDQEDLIDQKKVAFDDKRQAWAPVVAIDETQYSSIHINFHTLLKVNVSNLRVARTVIHEASHKFCNTMDHAYAEDLTYKIQTLYLWQTATNADSYAYAAVSLAEGVLFESDEQMCSALETAAPVNLSS